MECGVTLHAVGEGFDCKGCYARLFGLATREFIGFEGMLTPADRDSIPQKTTNLSTAVGECAGG